MFTYIKRISLFLLTNLAVLVLLGFVMSVVNYFYPNLLTAYGDFTSLLAFAAIFGFGGAIISLLLSRWQAKKMYGIILLDSATLHQEDARLQLVYQTVERIAKSKNIDMPEVGYYESAEPNAFATGASRNSALVAVSTGLLNTMENREIEGVVGHEMAHVLNGDMVTLTLITGVMNTFVIVLSHIVSRIVAGFLSRSDSDEGGISQLSYFLVYNVLQVVFGLLASIVIMYFSRMREYRADLGGAEFTSKASMIAGLKRLQQLTKLQDRHVDNGKLTAFMISEPDSFWSTHPSLDNRIKALEENYQLP
ncbi:MAG: protease HtpX [Candidatus Gracilibacteria bacterium]|nr:protease HtpX [Candidatus Gracilibacteria bacterium]